MPRVVSHASVMVHPHYLLGYHGYSRAHPLFALDFDPKRLLSIKLKPKLVGLANGNELARLHLSGHELMHRFYKRQVDEARKKRGGVLLLIKGQVINPSFYVKQLVANGVQVETAERIVTHIRGYQEKLERYATKKLGSRFFATEIPQELELHRASNFFETERKKRGFSLVPVEQPTKWNKYATPVSVFGEVGKQCVSSVCDSFYSLGFIATDRTMSKTVF